MKKILILSNHHSYTYNFRKEIINAFISENYKVTVAQPYGPKVEYLKQMGCECVDIPLDRRGKNILSDSILFVRYYKLIKKNKPDIVISYTIKPNLYGGILCRFLGLPHIPNITGLGTAVEEQSVLQKAILLAYKFSFRNSNVIMFQNQENLNFFKAYNIGLGRKKLLPGSGVNLSEFQALEYPSDEKIKFVFISRIMKEKGIEQFLDAAKSIKNQFPNTEFHICGSSDDNYKEKLHQLNEDGIIIYHGLVDDVKEILSKMHCVVHPSYYPEGISNILLESAASAKPLITTNRSGCREVVDHEVSGYICNTKDSNDLIEKIKKFLELNNVERKVMGEKGRMKVEREFDRNLVVESYVEEIKKI